MHSVILDSDTKARCVAWFKMQIASEYGKLAENFLDSFPFPKNEKHTLTAFLKTIEDNQYLSLAEMAEHFQSEVKFITSLLGSNSDPILFIKGYFYTLTKKIKNELLPAEEKMISEDMQKIYNEFSQFRSLIPNSREEFIIFQNEASNNKAVDTNAMNDGSSPSNYSAALNEEEYDF